MLLDAHVKIFPLNPFYLLLKCNKILKYQQGETLSFYYHSLFSLHTRDSEKSNNKVNNVKRYYIGKFKFSENSQLTGIGNKRQKASRQYTPTVRHTIYPLLLRLTFFFFFFFFPFFFFLSLLALTFKESINLPIFYQSRHQ